MSERTSFYELTRDALEQWFEDRGEPRYRGRQIFVNVYQRGLTRFADMTDLPKGLRAELDQRWDLEPLFRAQARTSTEANAVKTLWRLADGKEIESVFMTADYRETICFSTQVGCAFGCSFCVTAKMGRLRNLTHGEIVAQVHTLARERPNREKAVNLVAMGMGEPLDNLDALLGALAIVADPYGMNLSGRRVTVSTVGVVPGIDRLARERPDVRLALSLNATTNEVRRELMPVTRKYPLETLLPAVEAFARTTEDRVTLEYVLIKGLNDSMEDADRLGRIAARFPSKVNVIPFNPSELFDYERPSAEAVNRFAHRLWRANTTVTVRYSKGVDIQAACGQLGYDQVQRAARAKA